MKYSKSFVLLLLFCEVLLNCITYAEEGQNKRISRRKCEEYAKIVKEDECIKKPKDISGKAQRGEYPHMVLLGFDENGERKWRGSGVLISEDFVLTAVICTYHRNWGEPVEVRLGELDLNTTSDDENVENIKITKIIRHPKFKAPSKYYYLALLRLERPVKFSKYIRPACLPATDYNFNSQQFVLAGWGFLPVKDRPAKSYLMYDQLMKPLSHDICSKEFEHLTVKRQVLPMGIQNESQICFYDREESCQIPSGASVQIENTEFPCASDVVAFLSFGKSSYLSCNPTNPSVYTKVNYYVDWIEKIVWPMATN